MYRHRWLSEFGNYALAAGIAVIALIVASGVFFRYVMGDPLAFSFDLSILVFAWVILIGAAVAHVDGEHIAVDFVQDRISPKLYRIVKIARELLVAAVSSYVAWYGFELAMRTRSKIVSLDLSNRYLYIAVPIGFALIALISLWRAFRLATSTINPPDQESIK
ncbi:TRAP transporter small permease [Pseudorhizobium flavum]|uniref:TRAP transporter small permease n=1 Tax=Pseudorhizobium flavum TaxID=1335061 RepID=UPI00376F58D9